MSRISLALALTLLSTLGSVRASAAESAVHWQSDIEAACATAAQSNRLVLVHFWGSNCKPCVRLENTVFTEPQFAAVLEADYVPVKINVDQFPVTADRYGVRAWPTDVILTPDGKMAGTIACPSDGVEYARRLRETASSVRRANAQFAQADRSSTNVSRYDTPREAVANYAPREEYPRAQVTAVEQQAPSSPSYGSDRRYTNDFGSVPPQDRAAPLSPDANAYAGPTAASAPRMTTREGPVAKSNADEGNPALPYGSLNGASAAASPGQSPYTEPASANPTSARPAADAPRAQAAAQPSAQPVLCLDGHCPVTLMETQKWVYGDRRFGAVHRGRLYLFASAAHQQRFLAEPDRYSPAISGHDAVAWVEQGQFVRGEIKYGGFYEGYIYLFSSEATLRQFEANPQRYAGPVLQALAAGRGQGQIRR